MFLIVCFVTVHVSSHLSNNCCWIDHTIFLKKPVWRLSESSHDDQNWGANILWNKLNWASDLHYLSLHGIFHMQLAWTHKSEKSRWNHRVKENDAKTQLSANSKSQGGKNQSLEPARQPEFRSLWSIQETQWTQRIRNTKKTTLRHIKIKLFKISDKNQW